eukprot:353484-Lingulodinium_polyedra.AAC.1
MVERRGLHHRVDTLSHASSVMRGRRVRERRERREPREPAVVDGHGNDVSGALLQPIDHGPVIAGQGGSMHFT